MPAPLTHVRGIKKRKKRKKVAWGRCAPCYAHIRCESPGRAFVYLGDVSMYVGYVDYVRAGPSETANMRARLVGDFDHHSVPCVCTCPVAHVGATVGRLLS